MRFLAKGHYVVGIDAGATHTRAVVISADGDPIGRGEGPGANPNSGGDLATALGTALRAALGDLDPLRVAGGVFGIAGAGSAGRPRAVRAANEAWRAAGLPGEPHVVTDIVVAYAAGTTEPAGLVLFAGTGAGAAVIENGEIVRRADAYGWLVGDEGSAVWIGRAAVRAALRAHDGRGEPTTLADAVPHLILGTATEPQPTDGGPAPHPERAGAVPDLAQEIVKDVYARTPAELGRFAPLVSAAATAGDPVATRIVREAAERLLADVDALTPTLKDVTARADAGQARPSGAGRPGLVVAGSLLRAGPVADAVRAGLRDRFGVDPAVAGDGALGAARLAAARLPEP